MPRRFVVLGDMVDSRLTEDRGELGAQVRAALDRLGDEFAGALQARPAVTRGLDEFSAAFSDPGRAFDLLVRLNLRVWPNRFRLAAVLGEVDVGADSDDAALMDGPAFHAAADGIRELKARGRLFRLGGDVDPAAASMASALGSAHQAMTAGLKERTIAALRVLYDRRPDEAPPTQEEIAEALGLGSRQAVSDALRRADVGLLQQMEAALRGWLGGLASG